MCMVLKNIKVKTLYLTLSNQNNVQYSEKFINTSSVSMSWQNAIFWKYIWKKQHKKLADKI